ncbi:MAG: hypothetical protein ACXAC7_22355, partial [Candidatus Hodarchaeales archaeon]
KGFTNDIQQLTTAIQQQASISNTSPISDTTTQSFDNQQLQNVVREEISKSLGEISNEIKTQFDKIDRTLGRFFQKSVTDSKEVKELLTALSESNRQVKPTRAKVSTPTSYDTRTDQPQAKSPSYKILPTTDHTPTSPIQDTRATSRSTPSYTAPAFSGEESDIAKDKEATFNLTNVIKQGNISPRDALSKLERLRDTILFDRTSEAPYRGHAAKTLREALSIVKMERGSRILSEQASNDIIQLLEGLSERINY